MTTKNDLLERLDRLADEARTMRGDVAMFADHTFELDALRARVREIESDKLDLIDIANKYSIAITPWFKSGTGSIDLDVLSAAFSALDEYKREHGGML